MIASLRCEPNRTARKLKLLAKSNIYMTEAI
jgi:hypothetical protein